MVRFEPQRTQSNYTFNPVSNVFAAFYGVNGGDMHTEEFFTRIAYHLAITVVSFPDVPCHINQQEPIK
jgi:hypothetical protein